MNLAANFILFCAIATLLIWSHQTPPLHDFFDRALLPMGLVLVLSTVFSLRLPERRLLPFIPFAAVLGVALVTAFGAKAAFKQYDAFSAEVRRLSGEAPLACVRTRFDELFDPVLYRITRPVSLLDPTSPTPDQAFLLVRTELAQQDSHFHEGRKVLADAAFGGTLLSPKLSP